MVEAAGDEYLRANPSVKGGVDIVPLLVCVRPGADLEQRQIGGQSILRFRGRVSFVERKRASGVQQERGQTVDRNSSWAQGSRALAVLRWSWL